MTMWTFPSHCFVQMTVRSPRGGGNSVVVGGGLVDLVVLAVVLRVVLGPAVAVEVFPGVAVAASGKVTSKRAEITTRPASITESV